MTNAKAVALDPDALDVRQQGIIDGDSPIQVPISLHACRRFEQSIRREYVVHSMRERPGRQKHRGGVAIVFALAAICLAAIAPVSALAQPWGPGTWEGRLGYCAPDPEVREGSKGVRPPRDGLIVLDKHWPGVWGRLGMLGHFHRRGETVVVRTENIGTVRFVDSRNYQIEQSTEQGWLRLGPRFFRGTRMGGVALLGSSRARCFAFHIPANASPGLYRVTKLLEYDSPETGERLTLTLTREFRVLSPLLR